MAGKGDDSGEGDALADGVSAGGTVRVAPEESLETQGIAAVATATGLSTGTLRWYEKEGMIPAVPRDPAGRRAYGDQDVRPVELLMKLRRTGLPVAAMKRFAELLGGGSETHAERLEILVEHRIRILERMAQLASDLSALDEKTAHYEAFIAVGLECGEPARGQGDRKHETSKYRGRR